jgi:membrane protein DedA with SNARE-associated domain
LLWAGAYVATGWLFRRQLEDVAAALSRFGVTIGIVLGAGLVEYLVFKFVRLWRQYHAYRMHRIPLVNSSSAWSRASHWW